ncbi:MAG: hypothetical protein LBO05_02520 [Deltaproteobacteria bacterium]|nr:hypothetical protein [Deltaproteobacteria bacterium]
MNRFFVDVVVVVAARRDAGRRFYFSRFFFFFPRFVSAARAFRGGVFRGFRDG